MKKITLILSIMLIWGCSQAHDQEAVEAAVKEAATKQVEEAKAVVKEVAKDQVEAVSDQVEAVSDQVEAVAEQAVAAVADKVPAAFQAGIHYQVINPAYETGADEEVIVYEFFGYPCPHCATFEPYMKKLEAEMPENSKIVRIPVVFGQQWQPFAQAYYTFEAMDIVDQVHGPMFEAIHQHKKQFRSIDEIAVWAASSFGVDKEQFLSTAKSFMIDGQVRKGMQMLQAMGVTSTPTLVTNGKFMPNTKALKSRNDIIEITQFLINQELDAM
jgi:thiol:disulfide interchange protein DsbA